MTADCSVTATFVPSDNPAMLENSPGTFATIQQAYDAIPSGQADTIRVKAGEQAPGDIMFERDVTLRLEGGYDDLFSSIVSDTEFIGTLTIKGDPVTIANVIIK